MINDHELLRRYANDGSEDAFAELVRRHLDLVYSAALRQLNGDAHLARDAAQQVFVDLARKARELGDRTVLAGWLYVSTRFAAAKLVRTEQRRRMREQEAHLMTELTCEDGQPEDWGNVRPVLDEALGQLSESDRNAILLRYFEGQAFADVGARLGLAENAARMRVERALAKLHGLLARRGVTSSAGALAAALASHAVAAAPTGLAAIITNAAVSAAGAALGAGAGGGVLAWIGLSKLQAVASLAVAVAGVGGLTLQEHAADATDRELASLRTDNAEIVRLREENAALDRTIAEVRRLRNDDAALAQLREEALQLKRRVELAAATAARAEVARRAGGTNGPMVDIAKLDRLPEVVRRESPKYPAEMLAAGIAGTVVVRLIVDANGAVRDVFPVRSSRADFEPPAIEAVSRWEFDPGLKSGRTVNTRMEVPITFSPGAMSDAEIAVAVGEIKPVANADWF